MKKSVKLVIVGGVAGGATAATRARRLDENAEIILLERGEHISFANCGLPYHISGDIPKRDQLLLRTAKDFWDRYRIEVRTGSEVTKISPADKKIFVKSKGEESEIQYDKLILSQGAQPMLPPIPHIEKIPHSTLRTIEDMDSIMSQLKTGNVKSVAVIGAGFIGLEMAEAFRQRGLTVTVIEMFPQVMPVVDPDMAFMGQLEFEKHGVQILTSVKVVGFTDEKSIQLEDGRKIPADFVLFSAGVRAEIALAKAAGLAISETGAIIVDEYLRTSDKDIFAVGDMIETQHRITKKKTRVPLAGPANRQGRLVAENALSSSPKKYAGVLGTAIVKIFDKSLASTGFSAKQLRTLGYDFGESVVHLNDHAGYFPGAERLALKLFFERPSGKVLGAQAFGTNGVDKRIDVIATAITGQMTVFDLETLDLAYAPPFSSANDPVNFAAFQAVNMLEGKFKSVTTQELQTMKDYVMLDLRSPAEIERYAVRSDFQIPVNNLRDRMQELPREKKIVCLCQSGLRSYLACRILEQNGYNNVYNLTGGYWSHSATLL